MKLQDIQFAAGDCCGIHQTATVSRADGVDVGLMRGEGDTYSVTLYRGGGLWKRECCVTADRAQALLDGAE